MNVSNHFPLASRHGHSTVGLQVIEGAVCTTTPKKWRPGGGSLERSVFCNVSSGVLFIGGKDLK